MMRGCKSGKSETYRCLIAQTKWDICIPVQLRKKSETQWVKLSIDGKPVCKDGISKLNWVGKPSDA